MSDPKPLYCSFCGKSQHEVRMLITSFSANICNECVDICAEITAEPRAMIAADIGLKMEAA